MTQLTHIKGSNYKIVGDDVEELISECVARIRIQSKDFYKRELLRDLEIDGISLIDVHAGMGIFYDVELSRNAYVECK